MEIRKAEADEFETARGFYRSLIDGMEEKGNEPACRIYVKCGFEPIG